MPDFTISLTDAQVQRLQGRVVEFNDSTGQNLTVKQWIQRRIKLEAIDAQELARVTKEAETVAREEQAATVNKRLEEMLAEVER